MDPELRSFLNLAAAMAAAGGVLSLAFHSPAYLVGAFFVTALIGLVSLLRQTR